MLYVLYCKRSHPSGLRRQELIDQERQYLVRFITELRHGVMWGNHQERLVKPSENLKNGWFIKEDPTTMDGLPGVSKGPIFSWDIYQPLIN